MKITEALVVLFLVLFCYLFLDKFLFRGELGEIWLRADVPGAGALASAASRPSRPATPPQASDGSRYP